MRKTSLAVALMCAVLVPAAALAQSATPATPAMPAAPAAPAASAPAAPASAMPAPASIAAAATVPSTEAFVKTAAAANQFEINSSKLALTKTKDKKIRAFAKQMIKDHTKIGKGFVAALGKAKTGITPAPGLGADLDKVMADLASKSGKDFDAAYLAAQTQGHKDAVGLFGGYAKGGDNAVMQAFAKKTLPLIEMHLQMCYDLAAGKKMMSH